MKAPLKSSTRVSGNHSESSRGKLQNLILLGLPGNSMSYERASNLLTCQLPSYCTKQVNRSSLSTSLRAGWLPSLP
jgi:hypothetical protein